MQSSSMPRQLPWKSGGGGSRTQIIKPSTHPPKTTRLPDDNGDDSFDSNNLTGSSKGKGKASAVLDPDTLLPNLSAKPSGLRTQRDKEFDYGQRATSSSPPPLDDDTVLQNESMRTGVSKFDLWDDEWMMVEDEFLETAKLFTRHLHIAEYDRLKETIEAKKKEAEKEMKTATSKNSVSTDRHPGKHEFIMVRLHGKRITSA